MQYDTTEELHIVVHHFPFQIVAAGGPVVMVDSFVAVDGDKVFSWISCQFAVEVGCCYNCLFIAGEALGCFFHNSEHHRHNLIECFLVYIEHFFLQLVNLVEDFFAFVDGRILYF